MRIGSEIFMDVIKRSNRDNHFFQRGPTFPYVRKSNCGNDGRAIMLASAGLSWTVEDTVVVMSPLSFGHRHLTNPLRIHCQNSL